MCLASVLFLFWSDRSRCNQWRCVRIATANYQINEEIRDKEVRVIGADGSPVGYGGGLKIKQFLLELEKKCR